MDDVTREILLNRAMIALAYSALCLRQSKEASQLRVGTALIVAAAGVLCMLKAYGVIQ